MAVNQPNIKSLVSLLQEGRFEELLEAIKQEQKTFPDHIELFKLKGCALGELGEPLKAREQFLLVLEKDPNSSVTLVNYITSCLADRDGQSALKALELFVDSVSDEMTEPLLDSIEEALRAEVITYEQLGDKAKAFWDANTEPEVEYVDSDGNPIEIDDEAAETMLFFDEKGNQVNKYGDLVIEPRYITVIVVYNVGGQLKDISEVKSSGFFTYDEIFKRYGGRWTNQDKDPTLTNFCDFLNYLVSYSVFKEEIISTSDLAGHEPPF